MGLKVDKGIDILQTINFVHGQDILTKSQEFIYQLDKGLRLDRNERNYPFPNKIIKDLKKKN